MINRRYFLAALGLIGLSGCRSRGGVALPGLREWGSHGMRDGQFASPRAIGVRETSGGQEIFVIDKSGRVQVFSAEGSFLRKWLMPAYEKGTPTAVYFSGERVIIPDTHYSQIIEYTGEGHELERWGSFGAGSAQFIYPTGLCMDEGGAYFFSEYGEEAHRVHVFDKKRQFLRQWGGFGEAPGQFSRPMSIARASDGTLCVADTANHRVQCFDALGQLKKIFGGDGTMKYPHDVAVGPDDTLYVAEYGAHRISRLRLDGTMVATYGEAGRGPGQFNAPRGVAVASDGTVYVADTDNHRVQAFRTERAA